MFKTNRLRKPAIRFLSVLSMIVAVSSPAFATAIVGQPAPDFSITDTNGVKRSLTDLKGHIVALEWTNADCPFVRKHYGSSNMQTLQKEATDKGIVWLSVISSAPGHQGYVSAEEANALTVSRKAHPTGILLDPDGTLGHLYSAKTTPHMFLIDKDGILRYAGGIDSIASTDVDDIAKAEPYFREAYQALLHDEVIKNPITRSYGCGVKYAE